MAKQQVTYVTDDIDGSDNAETVQFSAFGVDYTIDLGKKNRAKLEVALAPFVQAATAVKAQRGSRGRSTRADKVQSAAVRDWARRNGHDVNDRGRVPAHVMEAFAAAH